MVSPNAFPSPHALGIPNWSRPRQRSQRMSRLVDKPRTTKAQIVEVGVAMADHLPCSLLEHPNQGQGGPAHAQRTVNP